MTIDPTAAFRNHMAIRTQVHDSTIFHMFMSELKFPPKLKMRFLDTKELNTEERQEAAFRTAFPDFPYLVGVVPPSISTKLASIPSLLGRAGDLACVYDRFCLRYTMHIGEATPILLMRLPRMKSLYVASVTLRSEPLGFQITLPSGHGYFVTIESLADFMRHATGDHIREWLQNAVPGPD